MCYEFSSWSWKARAKHLDKAQTKPEAAEQKSAPAKQPSEQPVRTRPAVKETEKTPA
jgi:hypothetical protein